MTLQIETVAEGSVDMTDERNGDNKQSDDTQDDRHGYTAIVAALGAAISEDLRKQMEGFGTALALATRSPVLEMIGEQMVSAAVEQVIAAAAPITEQVHQQMLDMNKLVEPIQETMKPWIDAQRSMVEPLIRQMEQDKEYAEAIGPYFEEAGLWFSGEWPLAMWGALARVYSTGELTTTALKEYILDTYHKDDYQFLETTVESWWDQPAFARWQRHLVNALRAHKQGYFTLSVPTLILVSEDLMREVSGTATTSMSKLSTAIQEMLSEWGLSPVSERPLAVALERLAKPGGLLDPIPSSEPERWHRHRILHGRDPDYDTALNSLRFFILLDELHALLGARALENRSKPRFV